MNQSEKNSMIKKFIMIIKNQDIDSIITFINNGADVNIKNYSESHEIDKTTKNFYRQSILFNHEWTPIMYAIYYKEIDFLKILLINKADPNICEYYGLSPFTIAVIIHQNNIEYIKLLIQYGANINIGTINSLHILAKIGNWKLLEFILKYHPFIDIIDHYNNTPLMYASVKGHLNCIKLLLHYNANINIFCNNKNILISIILLNNDLKIIDFLLNHKINVNFVDEFGKSALMYSIEKGYFDVAILLIKYGANIHIIDNQAKNILMYTAKYNNIFLFKSFIDLGVNINHIDHKKNNVLMYLCKYGNVECLRYLLRNNSININQMNDYFVTAYIVSKYYQQDECKNLLLDYGVITDDYDDNIDDKDDIYYPYYYLMGGIMD